MSDLNTYLQDMSGGSAANKWDIVCSYSTKELNKILEDKYSSEKPTIYKDITFDIERADPFTGEKFKIKYELTLGAPSFSFIAGINGKCKLVMAIKGKYTIITESGKAIEKVIPSNKYSLNGILPIVAVCGTANSSSNNEPKIVEEGNIINFSEQIQKASVTLQFKHNEETSWSISPSPGPDDKDIMETYFLPAIAQYFKDSSTEIDYTLASISSKSVNIPGDQIVIEPLSFVFATYAEGDKGALSLYIQTKNSGNSAGNKVPSFQPDGKAILPFSDGYTASLILSSDFFQKVCFKASLERAGWTDIRTSPKETIIYAKNNYKARLVANEVYYDHGQEEYNYYDGKLINGGDNYIKFTFFYDGQNHKMKLNIKLDPLQYQQFWQWSRTTGGYGASTSDDAKITISIDEEYDLGDPNIYTITDTDINLTINVNPTITVSTDAGLGMDFVKKTVISYITKEIGSMSCNLSLGGINIFRTTNLLFPMEKVLKFDSKIGFLVPCDLVLLGSIL
ncbi:hypothetical protein [Clostridium sp. JS66]|uniref:hypothetical protein n=1 Tax=Clostridium sp. JS66 TaxID=3064705 RepID=UPI00298E8D6B|nr:hypothetical protein [Clostridium sp. JS66]WPC43927.1 hypothetical protein Q6H37_10750 [Clostridium sp. JS66]